jgi:hypothetical protein
LSKSLLLISPKSEDQKFAAEVAVTAGLSLKHVQEAKEGADLISQEEIHVVFVDASTEKEYQKFETAIQDSVGIFSDKINPNAIHFLSSEELEKILYLLQSPLFGHYILRNFNSIEEVGQHYGRVVKATLAERAFGLENLLKPGSKVQNIKLNSSAQKQEAVDAVKNYLLAAKFQSRMATVVANAVDELLMNAIFDAPVDELGKPTLSTTPRSTAFPLDGKNLVEMQVGFDGKYVGISAIDHFGSLEKAKLLSHISKIYVKEEYKVRTTVAGAGIGCE